MKKKEVKKYTYKQLFNLLFSDLKKKWEIIDNGLDWLRLRTETINFNFDLYKRNSTIWNNSYITIWNVDYLIVFGKSSMWETASFISSFNYKGFSKPINNFRILKNRFNNNYILDIYWLTFQLQKQWGFDIQYILDYFLIWESTTITRIDYNINFNLKWKIKNYISKTYKKYERGSRNNYNNETITYWLYTKKGRSGWKVVYKMTNRFWFRLYNKIQNIFDLWIWALYEQYLWLNIIRLEWILWSTACQDIKYWNLDFIKKQAINKILWEHKIIDSNNNNFKRKTNKQLEKMGLDINSRIKTFVFNGWDLRNLKNLSIYIDNKDNIEEWFF